MCFQLTTALLHLEALEIIHADIKPENIMVVDRRQHPLRVKIIDFGLALHVYDAVPGSCVQSLWYRLIMFLETKSGQLNQLVPAGETRAKTVSSYQPLMLLQTNF